VTGYRARSVAHLLVAVALAGSVLTVVSGCGGSRPAQQTTEEGRAADRGGTPSLLVFRGASDASAAVALGERAFVVADDENNVLRAYDIEGGGQLFRFDLTAFLAVAAKSPEADIEGAARVGNRAYWITSHGRNRNGKWRPNRCRFFATEILTGAGGVTVRGIGRPYKELAERLVADQGTRAVCPALAKSYRPGKPDGDGKRRLAPKEHGLNIEGLCASADGNSLYIGLRNPLVSPRGAIDRRAIVVPLLNPAEVVEQARPPRFGRPMLWRLKGLGIRDMVRSEHHRATFVIAGPPDGGRGSMLYRWSEKADEQPVSVKDLGSAAVGWCPEALVAFARSPRLLLLSDDGNVRVPVGEPSECLDAEHYRSDGTCLNKHLRDQSRRSFRARWIVP